MRKVTDKLLELIDEGMLDPRDVALACMKDMSEDEVADMATANEFIADDDEFEEDEEEED